MTTKTAKKLLNNKVTKEKNKRLPNRTIIKFLEVLKSVNTTDTFSKLNETTMSDNNGGRIKF